jgi:hypothetical protein
MKTVLRRLAVFLVVAPAVAGPGTASADPNDFRFALVQASATAGDGAVLTLRLVGKDGAGVPGAVIFAVRLDMAPDGMAAMTAPVEAAADVGGGLYSLRTDLAMEGNWRLQVAARVQGEPDPVLAELPLEVLS